jgi:metal-dependent amidase/aminoacylase/carboxypeptidase family protein
MSHHHSPVIEAIGAETDVIIRLRRDFHAHPEICLEESGTAHRIARSLTEWRIPLHRGVGKTGVVSVIKSREGGRAIGLRADMDALPMTEKVTFPHASFVIGNGDGDHRAGHT